MRIYALLFFVFVAISATAFPLRAGLVLQNTPLFLEKDLSQKHLLVVYEGTMVEVLEAPKEETLDKDQNQKFPWFFVKIPTGESGWVYGNNVAVQGSFPSISSIFPRKIATETSTYPSIFGTTRRWFAFVQGQDAGVYDSSAYVEAYLVLTNPVGKSLWYPCGQLSGEGKKSLISFHEMDVTGDNLVELILELETVEKNSVQTQRWVEILSIQSGFLQNIYTDDLSLYTHEGQPAPSLYKNVEIDRQGIRVEFLDFQKCKTADFVQDGFEYCLQSVVSYLSWEPNFGQFQPLYPTLTLPPQAILQKATLMRELPGTASVVIAQLRVGEALAFFRFFEKITLNKGEKHLEPWAFVQTTAGKNGFIDARMLDFKDAKYAHLFSQYLKVLPISRMMWQSRESSVKVIR